MTGRLPLLAGILVAQVALIVLVMLGGGGNDAGEPFLEIEPDAVTGIQVADGEGETVSLSRSPEGWRVGELPADEDKVKEVMEKLTSSEAIWPVATSEEARKRFEVTDDSFQRKLTLQGDGEVLARIYLGTSPGFRRVHARREGQDAVFSIDFAVHDLPVGRSAWLDKRLLGSSDVRRVTLADGSILARSGAGAAGEADGDSAAESTAGGDGWTLDGAATDPEAVRRFVERLERLSVLGLYEPDEGDELGEARSLVVEDARGSHRLTFRFHEADNQYVLTSDRVAGEFTVASYVAEQVLADGSELLAKEEDEPDGANTAGADVAADAESAADAGEGTPDGAGEEG